MTKDLTQEILSSLERSNSGTDDLWERINLAEARSAASFAISTAAGHYSQMNDERVHLERILEVTPFRNSVMQGSTQDSGAYVDGCMRFAKDEGDWEAVRESFVTDWNENKLPQMLGRFLTHVGCTEESQMLLLSGDARATCANRLEQAPLTNRRLLVVLAIYHFEKELPKADSFIGQLRRAQE